jgi:hypothetical protein
MQCLNTYFWILVEYRVLKSNYAEFALRIIIRTPGTELATVWAHHLWLPREHDGIIKFIRNSVGQLWQHSVLIVRGVFTSPKPCT